MTLYLLSVRWGILLGALLTAATALSGADLYVHNQTGNDNNPGTVSQPLATAKRALKNAKAGDTIHLFPLGAVYREMLSFIIRMRWNTASCWGVTLGSR